MAKKESNGRSLFNLPILLILLFFVGVWWFWEGVGEWKDTLYSYIENKEILTLESRYTPEQIMQDHELELLGTNGKRAFQNPITKYYPYLLMDVKFTDDKKSREGILLWSMTDGEIVLNSMTWETTHGFKDCLECKADRQDFKILQALAKHQGTLTFDQLQNELQIEPETLQTLIDKTKNKHLIVQKGSVVKLHFENPKLLVIPHTQLKQHLVFKAINSSQKVTKSFSRNQIVDMAKAAFGSDFKIRSEKEVFLPVYSVGVLNPDGSIHTSDWNVITGQKIPSYLGVR